MSLDSAGGGRDRQQGVGKKKKPSGEYWPEVLKVGQRSIVKVSRVKSNDRDPLGTCVRSAGEKRIPRSCMWPQKRCLMGPGGELVGVGESQNLN